ncbi:MAG: hypothetical protein NTV09_04730 [Bacteroidetes bacterium]|nr:hypothetical protein [Bacteroidota bacterium]
MATISMLLSCRHEPDLTNVPEVHFSTEIQSILSGNCTMSGCHDGNEQFSLIGYDNVIANGSVKSYNAHGSKLYNSLKGGGEAIMPPASSPSLTSKQIQQIYVWIEQGALNN